MVVELGRMNVANNHGGGSMMPDLSRGDNQPPTLKIYVPVGNEPKPRLKQSSTFKLFTTAMITETGMIEIFVLTNL